jgi:hypothetical protein
MIITMNIGNNNVVLLTLLNLLNDDTVSRLDEANTHPPVKNRRQIVGLLFADNLAVSHN